MFNVRDDNNQDILNKTQSHAFYHAVAQLLFTGIRCRKDAKKEISFLKTRVRKPDKDDLKKLWRLIGYLKRMIKLPLILRTDRRNVIKWWVDVSYASHDDMW